MATVAMETVAIETLAIETVAMETVAMAPNPLHPSSRLHSPHLPPPLSSFSRFLYTAAVAAARSIYNIEGCMYKIIYFKAI